MALDQVAADVYAAQLVVQPEAGAPGAPSDARRIEAVRGAQAHLAGAQAVVDAIADGEAGVERVVDLRAGRLDPPGVGSWLLLCTDRRVVWATTSPEGATVDAFAFGELAVDRRLASVAPRLDPGPPPVLEVPRVWPGDKDLTRAIERSEPTPDPVRTYVRWCEAVREGTALVPFHLQVPRSAPGTEPAVADGSWQPDPTGRHELRWWDGSSWTDFVADDGVTGAEPV